MVNLIKAISSLGRQLVDMFKSIWNTLISIPKILVSLYDAVISLYAFFFNFTSSIDEAIDFLQDGMNTVTTVLGFMPEPLLVCGLTVLAAMVLRFFLDLFF